MRGKPTESDKVFVAAFRLALMTGRPRLEGIWAEVTLPAHDAPRPRPIKERLAEYMEAHPGTQARIGSKTGTLMWRTVSHRRPRVLTLFRNGGGRGGRNEHLSIYNPDAVEIKVGNRYYPAAKVLDGEVG